MDGNSKDSIGMYLSLHKKKKEKKSQVKMEEEGTDSEKGVGL